MADGDAEDAAAAADVAICDANGRDGGNAVQRRHQQSPYRHIRQLAHINLTCLPSLSRADRSKTLLESVRQIVVARPSFVALLVIMLAAIRTPVPDSSAPPSRRPWRGRRAAVVLSPASPARLSLEQRSGAAALQPSAGLSVSARSIFISTPRAINLRHGTLLRLLQASQRPPRQPASRSAAAGRLSWACR